MSNHFHAKTTVPKIETAIPDTVQNVSSYCPKGRKPKPLETSQQNLKLRDISQYAEVEQIYTQTLGQGFRTLSLVAPGAGTGCTSIAAALAFRHASVGKTVLLIDLNLRNPGLDTYFKLPRTRWPEEIEQLPEQLTELLQSVSPGVKVLTANLNGAATIKTRQYLEPLFTGFLRTFDAIIFDTSPLDAVNQNNVPAETLAALTEATLLILQSCVTTEAALRESRAKLANNKINLVGAVINDRSNPNLADELIREVSRLDKRCPRLTSKLKQWITQNHFLNMAI